MLEIIAVVFSFVCVILTYKQNIWCWPVGIIGIIGFFFVFYAEDMYFQTGLQIIFLIQSLYGWYIWNKGTPTISYDIETEGEYSGIIISSHKELDISTQPILKTIIQLIIAILIPIIIVESLYTDITILEYLDPITSSLAILATWYMVYKKIEAWIVWMLFNSLMFIFMIGYELYITAGLELVLLIISFNAFLSWRKILKQ